MTIAITNANFQEEVINSEIPVLVDFWAEWCGPCRMLAPAIDEIARDREGKIKIGKINVDDAPQLAARFGVASIPTLILFKEGKPVASSIGYKPKAQIEAMLA